MNETLKVKSSSTLRSQRNSGATLSARLRIVPSDSAASSVGHSRRHRRWAPFAAASDAAPASSTRRQPETVAARPRTGRGQRETVRDAAPTLSQLSTVPHDDLTSMRIPDSSSNRTRQLSNRQLLASQGSGPVCPVCRVPKQRCQCPELHSICPLSSNFLSFTRQRRMTAVRADPVRRTSRGQQNTVPGVTPVNSRRRVRDTVTDIAPANPIRRSLSRLETAHVALARPRRRSMRPTTSQHSMSLRDSNIVDLPELRSLQLNRIRLISAPHLAYIGNSALYELLDHTVFLSRFIRMASARGIAGPIPTPHELTEMLTVMAFSNDDLVTSESDEPGCMTKEEICQLPVRKVPNSAIPSQPCIICLKDYERGDLLRVMPCHHEFHQKCLDQWLAIKRNCPVCRKVL